MLPEDGVVEYPHNVVLIVLILALEEAKQAQLDSCLMLESFLIADYFDCHHRSGLVVIAFQGLSKAARPEFVKHFEPVSQMVLHDNLVVTSFVVKAEVVPKERRSLDFGRVKP